MSEDLTGFYLWQVGDDKPFLINDGHATTHGVPDVYYYVAKNIKELMLQSVNIFAYKVPDWSGIRRFDTNERVTITLLDESRYVEGHPSTLSSDRVTKTAGEWVALFGKSGLVYNTWHRLRPQVPGEILPFLELQPSGSVKEGTVKVQTPNELLREALTRIAYNPKGDVEYLLEEPYRTELREILDAEERSSLSDESDNEDLPIDDELLESEKEMEAVESRNYKSLQICVLYIWAITALIMSIFLNYYHHDGSVLLILGLIFLLFASLLKLKE